MPKSIRRQAAEAVLRGRGWKPGQKLSPKVAHEAKYDIEVTAQSPMFRHLQERTKPVLPSDVEQERIRYIHALRYYAESPEFRSQRRDPEARRAIIEHARSLASEPPDVNKYTKKKRYTFTPSQLQRRIDEAELLKERRTLILLPNEDRWIEADRITGKREDGKPYVIAVGNGYSATILLVWANDDSEAVEIAENKWPKLLFSKIAKNPPEVDGEEEDGWEIISGLGKWGRREEDIRFFVVASEVSTAKKIDPYSRLYRLADGRVVEAAG